MGELTETTARVHRNRNVGTGSLGWSAETRVFASTNGSLITQHFMKGGARTGGGATLPANTLDAVGVDLPGLEGRSGGFELALAPGIIDYLLTGMEEAVRLREIPLRPFLDIGRYPIVLDGASFASLIGATASLAVDGDRVAGFEADASGTSFLVPPEEILNATAPQFSPLLTLTVDRTMPSVMAAQWDDEGVAPEPYTVIDKGRVVDYHTTRETAPLLAEWYAKQGRPLRSHGGAVAPTPASLPMCSGGHMHVTAGSSGANVYDLAREIQHGFIIRGGNAITEPGLTLGTMRFADPVLEIQRGRPIARTNLLLQFVTKAVLKDKLVALGGAETLRTDSGNSLKGSPWEEIPNQVTAPAALLKDVDVISWAFRK
jgi:TldD protein